MNHTSNTDNIKHRSKDNIHHVGKQFVTSLLVQVIILRKIITITTQLPSQHSIMGKTKNDHHPPPSTPSPPRRRYDKQLYQGLIITPAERLVL